MELMMTELEEGIVTLYQLGWLYSDIAEHLDCGMDVVEEVIEEHLIWAEEASNYNYSREI